MVVTILYICVYFKTFSSKQKIQRKLVKSPLRNLVIRASFLHTEKKCRNNMPRRAVLKELLKEFNLRARNSKFFVSFE